jgi:beta-N-acetylhexosaminidase
MHEGIDSRFAGDSGFIQRRWVIGLAAVGLVASGLAAGTEQGRELVASGLRWKGNSQAQGLADRIDPDDGGASCVSRLSPEIRAGQLVMVGSEGNNVSTMLKVVGAARLGGFVLDRQPDDLASLPAGKAHLKRQQGVAPLVATDNEGGLVQRLQAGGALPSAEDAARNMTPREYEGRVAQKAKRWRGLGLDVNFAPAADVAMSTGIGPIDKDERAFSRDPVTVARYVQAAVNGMQKGGVLPVLKHAPGHGSAAGDTHEGAAQAPPLSNLKGRDLVPYARLAATDKKAVGVMMGHIKVPGLTGDTPASLSPKAYNLMRDMGFTGPYFTDSLAMGAITNGWSEGQAAVEAVKAGTTITVVNGGGIQANPREIRERGTRIVTHMVQEMRRDPRFEQAVDAAARRVFQVKRTDPCIIGAPRLA